ncbi:MAG: polysaccharide deacetylase family protein [Solobacterium sp.]|nr:polysaccharide deacetylase family protein [Solobacterium sp.]
MGRKYFAWSFDDGLEQDRKIVSILKEYGLGATFHLNSSMFGDKTYEGRIGNLGMTEKPADSFDPARRHLLPYVEHFRLSKEEAMQLYEGFEVASHTCHHVNLMKCSEEEREKEITEDVKDLSEIFGYQVTGFAFPYGVGAKQSREALQKAGIQYARTIQTAKDFLFPEDPLAMPMTCWHVSKKAIEKLDSFLLAKPQEEDLFFLMFAHGYEFDFNTKESNWDKFRRICERVSLHKDVTACSIGEAFRMHEEGVR